MVRAALAGFIRLAWPDVLVRTASDYAQAAEAAQSVDLILCDLLMPDLPPLQGVAMLREVAPAIPLMVVTGQEDDDLLLALFDLGIAGFVPKSADSSLLEAAIRLVLAGGRYLPPEVLRLVGPAARETSGAAHLNGLTDRQRDVLWLMSQGRSNKEIARVLNLSPATVKAHAAAVFGTLGVSNRTEAAYLARATGLVAP